jgi:hypothetical protein
MPVQHTVVPPDEKQKLLHNMKAVYYDLHLLQIIPYTCLYCIIFTISYGCLHKILIARCEVLIAVTTNTSELCCLIYWYWHFVETCCFHFYLEDSCSRFLQNVSTYLQPLLKLFLTKCLVFDRIKCTRFEVLTMVIMKNYNFWGITLCSML